MRGSVTSTGGRSGGWEKARRGRRRDWVRSQSREPAGRASRESCLMFAARGAGGQGTRLGGHGGGAPWSRLWSMAVPPRVTLTLQRHACDLQGTKTTGRLTSGEDRPLPREPQARDVPACRGPLSLGILCSDCPVGLLSVSEFVRSVMWASPGLVRFNMWPLFRPQSEVSGERAHAFKTCMNMPYPCINES